MRIQVLSDLHLEFRYAMIPPLAPDTDVVVLAGDLAPAKKGFVRIAADVWDDAGHILYVPGNHEYYGSRISKAQHELAVDCVECGVTLLDTAAVTVGGVRFIGATLWTDFRLYGEPRELEAHDHVGRGLNDFSGFIGSAADPARKFSTWESAQRHARDRAFIEAELAQAEEDGLEAVVVTHHAPTPRSVHPRFEGDRINPGFASDLEAVIERYQPALWIHGHMHDPVDLQIGRTRVLANPRGNNKEEAKSFVPDLVVEI